MQLVDTNVWLALAFQSHAHHAPAKAWITSAARQSCCFCRVTQMGFLRLATNRKIFPLDAVPMIRAWQLYDEMLADYHVVYAEEPLGIDTRWQNLTQSSRFSTNVWTDAYLAAFAITADVELVTFDKAFTQFDGLRSVILK
jgi:toxin-antitoxin system PIN domain toxin